MIHCINRIKIQTPSVCREAGIGRRMQQMMTTSGWIAAHAVLVSIVRRP